MSNVEDALLFIVTWITAPGCCLKCGALNGRQWTIPYLQQVVLLKDTLTHPHCKCEVDVQVDINLDKLQLKE
jgi:hypothetical protein